MIFILPWLIMIFVYGEGIVDTIGIILNGYFMSYTIWNASRFGILILVMFVNYGMLSRPIFGFKKCFQNLYKDTNLKIIKNLEKGHEIYLFYFKEYVNVDRQAIRRFFTTFLIVLFYFTLANIASILIGKYDLATLIWVMLYVVLVEGIAIIATLNTIQISESLVCFAHPVGSALSILSGRKARISISKHYKLLRIYEIVHNKKPFRFHFGSFGRLSKRSLVSFLCIYVAELLTITSKFIKK